MKNQKGITLIALIITIIVMLILVAVTVTIVVQSGLFTHAGDATSKYNEQQDIEKDIDNRITSDNVTGINNIIDHHVNGTEY